MINFGIVIVTYNRLNLLKECLQCVENQILKPKSVVIINNHSTDGTTEYLKKFCTSPIWTVINEKENLGGSGGYYEGIKIIRDDSRADWILLIDDDAMLSSNYLSDIQKAIRKFPSAGVFSGSVMTDGQIVPVHRRRWKNREEIFVPLSAYRHKYFKYDLSSFCGIVIKKDLILKVGLPEKDFFIWYDDTEYSMRLRENTVFINVCSCYINHKTKVPVQTDEQNTPKNWKVYYRLRNQIYSLRKHGMKTAALSCAVHYLARPSVNCLNFTLNSDQRAANKYNRDMFIEAIRDGYYGKLGKNDKYLPD